MALACVACSQRYVPCPPCRRPARPRSAALQGRRAAPGTKTPAPTARSPAASEGSSLQAAARRVWMDEGPDSPCVGCCCWPCNDVQSMRLSGAAALKCGCFQSPLRSMKDRMSSIACTSNTTITSSSTSTTSLKHRRFLYGQPEVQQIQARNRTGPVCLPALPPVAAWL